MKISGYTIERIHKNMYRIINADGQQVALSSETSRHLSALELGVGTHAEPQSLSATRDSPHRATTSVKHLPSLLSALAEPTSLAPNRASVAPSGMNLTVSPLGATL